MLPRSRARIVTRAMIGGGACRLLKTGRRRDRNGGKVRNRLKPASPVSGQF